MMPEGFEPFVPRVVSRQRRPEPAPIDPPVEESTFPEPAVRSSPEPHVDDRLSGVVRACDEEHCGPFIRERAIKLAGEACARALHEAIAKNPLFIARFVDDAIEAAGRATCKRVRLSPADAAACNGRIGTDVIADERLASGDAIVETSGGTVEATVDRRARLLVRAAADP
jgi:hypothetical protein